MIQLPVLYKQDENCFYVGVKPLEGLQLYFTKEWVECVQKLLFCNNVSCIICLLYMWIQGQNSLTTYSANKRKSAKFLFHRLFTVQIFVTFFPDLMPTEWFIIDYYCNYVLTVYEHRSLFLLCRMQSEIHTCSVTLSLVFNKKLYSYRHWLQGHAVVGAHGIDLETLSFYENNIQCVADYWQNRRRHFQKHNWT